MASPVGSPSTPSPPPPPSTSNSTSSSPTPSSSNSTSSPPPPPSSSPPPSSPSPPPLPSDDNNDNGNNDNDNGNINNDDANNNNNDGNNNNNNNNDQNSPPTPNSNSSSGNNGHAHSSSGHLPPSKHKSSHSSSKNDDSDSLEDKAIIGGVVGGAALLLIVMIALLVCCTRKKKRKSHNHTYYMEGSHANRNNEYYNSGQHPNWHNNPQANNHVVQMPSSEMGWPMAPPPPPPMMSSSELSSAAFSGPHQAAVPPPHPAVALGFNQSSFTYNDLAAATNGFAQSNLLGQGGFGYVHKGVLPNGKEVAVKSLKMNSGQGEREFQAEVDIISRVHHRHLVSLVGYCIAGAQRMLVYEFVPNGTLEYHLHGSNSPAMDWPTRLKIALGSAKGFAYLHEDCHPRIIHRDIKTANILLDENLEAKVADFGLAKLSNDTHTHVSTRIMGTFGYLAPEYAASGKLTEKSDVYSYGVMMLELITGRRPIDITSDDDSLVDWARPILMQVVDGEGYEEMVDPRLGNNYDPQEMLRLVACAGACIRHSARRRPKMSQIVRALEGDVSLEDLNEGGKPGGGLYGSSGSDYDSGSYSDLKKFRKAGLSSQEFSGEQGMMGEYGRSTAGNSQ